MKFILTDIYRIIYNAIHNKTIATLLATLLVVFFTFSILQGLCVLSEDMFPVFIKNLLFVFPDNLIFLTVLFLFYSWIMPTSYMMMKDRHREIRFVRLIIFTITAVISFLYVKYSDKIVF